MQKPTLTNIHIRSAEDAHKLFYAVQLGHFPQITRRLDAEERAQLRPGNVYVWEEKSPNNDSYAVSIERWTEGLSWSASRIRDEFLVYFENVKKKNDREESSSGKTKSLENMVVREGERDLYIKMTYSVFRTDVNEQVTTINGEKVKPRKWHLNAYFTKATEGTLDTIDSIPLLRDLVVPPGIFRSTRASKASKKASTSSDPSGSGKSSVQRTYAPFPSMQRRPSKAQQYGPPLPPPPPPSQSSTHAAPSEGIIYTPHLVIHPGYQAHSNPGSNPHSPISPEQQYPQQHYALSAQGPSVLTTGFPILAPAPAMVPQFLISVPSHQLHQVHQGYPQYATTSAQYAPPTPTTPSPSYTLESALIPRQSPHSASPHPSYPHSRSSPLHSLRDDTRASVHSRSPTSASAPAASSSSTAGAAAAASFPGSSPGSGSPGLSGAELSSSTPGPSAGSGAPPHSHAAPFPTTEPPTTESDIILSDIPHLHPPRHAQPHTPLPPLAKLTTTTPSLEPSPEPCSPSPSSGTSDNDIDLSSYLPMPPLPHPIELTSSQNYVLPPANVPRYDLSTGEYGNDIGGSAGGGRALAPLNTLARNHPYKRSQVDDRALRLLGPGAR